MNEDARCRYQSSAGKVDCEYRHDRVMSCVDGLCSKDSPGFVRFRLLNTSFPSRIRTQGRKVRILLHMVYIVPTALDGLIQVVESGILGTR
jgi:hypothetical protein